MSVLCGFRNQEVTAAPGGVALEEFEKNPKTNLFQRVFGLIPPDLQQPPNSVSQAYMFKPTPRIVRWWVQRADNLSINQARYMYGLAFHDWSLQGIQIREARNKDEATVLCEVVDGTICNADQAIGCYSWNGPDDTPKLQVLRKLYNPASPLVWVETAVHEFGHHLGLDDGYIRNSCGGGGPDYMGAMGFGEGIADRLGSRPSLHERAVVKRSAILRTYPRCQA